VTKEILQVAQDLCGFKLKYHLAPCGDKVKKETGTAIPSESIRIFGRCDAALKGPVGDTVRDFVVAFRQNFDLYANIRPAISYPSICPPALRPDINLVTIRENSEGLYKSIENEVAPGVWISIGVYTVEACKRIAKFSFDYTRRRLKNGSGKGQLVVATKMNIFRKTHTMFYEAFKDMSPSFPEIELTHFYADALCAHLVRRPQDFDVIVSENLLADLLSDLAGEIAGGLGMTAGTNINPEKRIGLFEPTHGCAPDIVGTGKANPIGQIRSAALMLEFLGLVHEDSRCSEAAVRIERATRALLTQRKKTKMPIELGGKAETDEVGRTIASFMKSKYSAR